MDVNDQAVEFALQYKNLSTFINDMFYLNAVCLKKTKNNWYYQFFLIVSGAYVFNFYSCFYHILLCLLAWTGHVTLKQQQTAGYH